MLNAPKLKLILEEYNKTASATALQPIPFKPSRPQQPTLSSAESQQKPIIGLKPSSPSNRSTEQSSPSRTTPQPSPRTSDSNRSSTKQQPQPATQRGTGIGPQPQPSGALQQPRTPSPMPKLPSTPQQPAPLSAAAQPLSEKNKKKIVAFLDKVHTQRIVDDFSTYNTEGKAFILQTMLNTPKGQQRLIKFIERIPSDQMGVIFDALNKSNQKENLKKILEKVPPDKMLAIFNHLNQVNYQMNLIEFVKIAPLNKMDAILDAFKKNNQEYKKAFLIMMSNCEIPSTDKQNIEKKMGKFLECMSPTEIGNVFESLVADKNESSINQFRFFLKKVNHVYQGYVDWNSKNIKLLKYAYASLAVDVGRILKKTDKVTINSIDKSTNQINPTHISVSLEVFQSPPTEQATAYKEQMQKFLDIITATTMNKDSVNALFEKFVNSTNTTDITSFGENMNKFVTTLLETKDHKMQMVGKLIATLSQESYGSIALLLSDAVENDSVLKKITPLVPVNDMKFQLVFDPNTNAFVVEWQTTMTTTDPHSGLEIKPTVYITFPLEEGKETQVEYNYELHYNPNFDKKVLRDFEQALKNEGGTVFLSKKAQNNLDPNKDLIIKN